MDYYKILNVSSNVNDNELKKQYKLLALKWHPDRNENNKEDAEEKFKKISEAYSVLSDKNKRREYDMEGTKININQNPFDIFKHTFNNDINIGNFSKPFSSTVKFSTNIKRSIYQKSSSIKIVNNIKIEETIEVKNGRTIKTIKQTDMNTGKTSLKIINN